MAMKTITINNTDYIGVDFNDTVEYFRNLKIRQASLGVLDDKDIRNLLQTSENWFY